MMRRVPTTPDERLLPDAWGIHAHWVDARDEVVAVAPATVEALRIAMGSPPPDLEARAPIVARRGDDLGLGSVEVDCEDGVRRTIEATVPADFPYGYHDLHSGSSTRRLIVSPGRCWLPEDWRAWGWTVQLYAARSRSGAGIGDLGDLSAIREWAQGLGAGFLLINPLHAVAPTLPQEASPYLPATRRFRNPIYLRVDDVVTGDSGPDDLIDRDTVWQAKLAALEQLYAAADVPDAFESWRREQGDGLEEFATWCTLAERHGPDWHSWPEDLHRPDLDGVRRLGRNPAHADRVRFHAWLQWLLERQLGEAAGDLAVLQDLPIGVDGGGADAWAWQDTLVDGVTVGAPPDIFNAQGQSWGSPPLAPWRLRMANYEPFVQSIRATMAGGGGIRIDHVMGLFRLWWIPKDGSPADGAYVRYPSDDLLDIVALESHRARSLVVGEDLGTVEPGVREALAEHAMLSYRLMWFEQDEPATWPTMALGAVTTHDLPTIAGLWTGADLEDQAAHVPTPRDALERDRAALLRQLPSKADGAETSDEIVVSAYEKLGQVPCVLLSATLEDAVGQQLRPNMPGTTDRPNWSIPLPVLVDDLPGHPLATRVAAVLDSAVRRG
jgi:4-alpha-glucanotransferase